MDLMEAVSDRFKHLYCSDRPALETFFTIQCVLLACANCGRPLKLLLRRYCVLAPIRSYPFLATLNDAGKGEPSSGPCRRLLQWLRNWVRG